MSDQDRTAILIDAENINQQQASLAIKFANEQGVSLFRRAYANWTHPSVQHWSDVLREHAIIPVQQFEHVAGKNSSDIILVVEAMELILVKQITKLVLVSSDSDFTPLVLKARELGVTVIGIGGQNVSKALVCACNHFYHIAGNNISTKRTSPPAVTRTSPVTQLKKGQKDPNKDKKLLQIIENTFEQKQKDGRLNSAVLGSAFVSHGISVSTYGFNKIAELVSVLNDFEPETVGSTVFIIRRKSVAVDKAYDDSVFDERDLIVEKESTVAKQLDTGLTNTIGVAIANINGGDGWVKVDALTEELLASFAITSNEYGYADMVSLLKNLPTFTIEKVSGTYFVSDTRLTNTPPPSPIEAKAKTTTTYTASDNTQNERDDDEIYNNRALINALDTIFIKEADETGWIKKTDAGNRLRELGIDIKGMGYKNTSALLRKLNWYDEKTEDALGYARDFNFTKKRKFYLATLANEPAIKDASNDVANDEVIIEAMATPAKEMPHSQEQTNSTNVDINNQEHKDDYQETCEYPKTTQATFETLENESNKAATDGDNTAKMDDNATVKINNNNATEADEVIEIDTPNKANEDKELSPNNQVEECINTQTDDLLALEITDNENSGNDDNGETNEISESDFSLTDLLALINEAIDAHKDNDGYAKVGDIGKYVRNIIGLGAQSFGYADFGKMLALFPQYEVERIGRFVMVKVKDE